MDTCKRLISSDTAMGKAKADRVLLGPTKRVIHIVGRKVARDIRETAYLFRIMVFLHSAKDFPTVLRLYGIERTSQTE